MTEKCGGRQKGGERVGLGEIDHKNAAKVECQRQARRMDRSGERGR